MHNQRQKLTFFLVIDKYIKEDLFLPKIIKKLKRELDQKTRTAINKRVDQIELEESKNTIKLLALFYCLHIQKPSHGHLSMFTKYLIKNTNIEFDPEYLNETNKKIKQLVQDIGLPSLKGTTKQFVQNLYYYEPDFLDEYPDIEVDLR